MIGLLQHPQFVQGLAYGGAAGLILGIAITAGLFFYAEAREQQRLEREAAERAQARRAAMAAHNWPAANDDTGRTSPRTARSEFRRAAR